MAVGGIPVTVIASGGAPVTPVGLTADLVAADGGQSVQEALDGKLTADPEDARAALGITPVPYVPGNWYPGAVGNWFWLSSAGTTATSTRLSPLMVRDRVTITDLGARVNTVSAGGLFRLGIYAASPTTLKATGLPLGSVGGLSTTSLAVVSGAVTPFVLEPDQLYWGAAQIDNATAALQSVRVDQAPVSAILGTPVLSDTSVAATSGLGALVVATVGYANGMTDLTAVAQSPVAAVSPLVWWKAAV